MQSLLQVLCAIHNGQQQVSLQIILLVCLKWRLPLLTQEKKTSQPSVELCTVQMYHLLAELIIP